MIKFASQLPLRSIILIDRVQLIGEPNEITNARIEITKQLKTKFKGIFLDAEKREVEIIYSRNTESNIINIEMGNVAVDSQEARIKLEYTLKILELEMARDRELKKSALTKAQKITQHLWPKIEMWQDKINQLADTYQHNAHFKSLAHYVSGATQINNICHLANCWTPIFYDGQGWHSLYSISHKIPIQMPENAKIVFDIWLSQLQPHARTKFIELIKKIDEPQ